MPNYVSNSLQIDQVTPEQIQRIITAAESNNLLNEFFHEPDWQNTPNEEGVLPGPRQFNRHFNKLWRGALRHELHVDGRRFPNGDLDQRWYAWRTNPEHWQTKWEVQDPTIIIGDDSVTLFFETAWAPPGEEWFVRLSQAMPNAVIDHRYSEPGMDFFGVTVAKDGWARQLCDDIEPIRNQFLQEVLGDDYAIYRNEDHHRHDEVYERGQELWWDSGHDALDEASVGMREQADDQINASTGLLKTTNY